MYDYQLEVELGEMTETEAKLTMIENALATKSVDRRGHKKIYQYIGYLFEQFHTLSDLEADILCSVCELMEWSPDDAGLDAFDSSNKKDRPFRGRTFLCAC